MTVTNPAKGYRVSRDGLMGPRAFFLATVTVCGSVIVSGILPNNLLMPMMSTLLFVLAAAFALVAWIRCSTDEYGVTYWDVAGAVAFIGMCTSAIIEPDQLARIFDATRRDQ
jgi:hypothetical protein